MQAIMMRVLHTVVYAAVLLTASAFMPHIAHNMHVGQKSFSPQMAETSINMPALSSTMKEGKIVSWNKKIGDKVNSGDVLLVVESDKADMDVEAFESGYLAAIYTPEGKSAPVGSVVAVLVDNVADISKVGSAPKTTSTASVPSAPAAAPAPAIATSASAASGGAVPDFEQITMPALSSTMKQGKIVSWNKKVGDKVSSGDVLLVVESDKADMDVESFESGFLAAIAVKDGEVASVGSPVGYLAKKSSDVPVVQAYLQGGGKAPSKPADPAAPEPFMVIPADSSKGVASSASASASAPTVVNFGRVSASGYAQQQAKEGGINLATVTPSRPDGYITSRDLSSGSKGGTGHSGAAHEHVPAPGSINASPSARKLAQEHGIDLVKVRGSGNFGRVMPDDVLKAAGKYVAPKVSSSASPAAASATAASATQKPSAAEVAAPLDGLVAMDGMQKAVAKNMEKTLSVPVFRVSRYGANMLVLSPVSSVSHHKMRVILRSTSNAGLILLSHTFCTLFGHREIVTDEFDALYAKLKDKGVTVSALLAKAVAEVLKKHPILNAAYDASGAIKYNKDINIAMAVAIDGGLITPTILKASELDVFSVGRAWKDLVARAKAKKLTPAEYSSGRFGNVTVAAAGGGARGSLCVWNSAGKSTQSRIALSVVAVHSVPLCPTDL